MRRRSASTFLHALTALARALARRYAPPSTTPLRLPEDRRRVTEAQLRQCLKRLRETGYLAVLIADLEDRADALAAWQLQALQTHLWDAGAINELACKQAARAEMNIIIKRWTDLGADVPGQPPARDALAPEPESE